MARKILTVSHYPGDGGDRIEDVVDQINAMTAEIYGGSALTAAPAAGDRSTKTPTTAWTGTEIDVAKTDLLSTVNSAAAGIAASVSSATTAAASVLGFIADSTTSLAIGTGDKTFTVPSGKTFAPGHPVRASSKADPGTNAMIGVVKSYSGTTLVIAVASVLGSGTLADWTIAVTSGALAPLGSTQDAQAIVRYGETTGTLAAASIRERPNLWLSFLSSTFFARGVYVGAAFSALVVALAGSTAFTRASTAFYRGSEGLLKTAAIDEMRFEYDPATLAPLGFLKEPARTNVSIRSQELDNAAWTKATCTITANATTAPDGTTTADKIVEDGTTAQHLVSGSNATVADNATVVASGYFKAAERSFAHFALTADGGTTPSVRLPVNLASGATGTAIVGGGMTLVSSSVENAGNGWWRVIIVATIPVGSTLVRLRLYPAVGTSSGDNVYLGDSASGVYFWGGQIEVGTFPTSYIPTTTVSVARSADSALTLSFATPTACSIFVEYASREIRADGSASDPLNVTNSGGAGDLLKIRQGTVISGVDLNVRGGGSLVVDSASYSSTAGTVERCAASISPTNWYFSKDGIAPAGSYTGGVVTPPAALNQVVIGGNNFYGHIRRVGVFPSALSSASVAALTASATWI